MALDEGPSPTVPGAGHDLSAHDGPVEEDALPCDGEDVARWQRALPAVEAMRVLESGPSSFYRGNYVPRQMLDFVWSASD